MSRLITQPKSSIRSGISPGDTGGARAERKGGEKTGSLISFYFFDRVQKLSTPSAIAEEESGANREIGNRNVKEHVSKLLILESLVNKIGSGGKVTKCKSEVQQYYREAFVLFAPPIKG